MKIYFFLIFILSFSLFSFQEPIPSVDNQLAFLFHLKSQTAEPHIKNKEFYLSSLEPFSLNRELNLLHEGFSRDQEKILPLGSYLFCRFPARYFWWKNKMLKTNKKLSLKNSLDFCPELSNFYQEFFPENIYLVFSSYYAKSASSLFGHTLLRFSRKESRGNELLDWGLSYAAAMNGPGGSTNPFLYSWRGLTGGMVGEIQALPYFYKVREYNDFESRDLWNYRILIDDFQKELFMYALWEFSPTQSDYYYLTANCSSIILDLMQILFPDISFYQKIPFYIIPAESIRHLADLKVIDVHPQYRPGALQAWQKFYGELNVDLKKMLTKIINEDNDDVLYKSNVSKTDQARLADALILYWDYLFARELLDERIVHPMKDRRLKLLTWRNQLPSISRSNSEILNEEKKIESPHFMHPSRRIGIGAMDQSHADHSVNIFTSFKFAFHDELDPSKGFAPDIKLTFIGAEAMFNKHQFTLLKFDILELGSFPTVGALLFPLSYYFRIGEQTFFPNIENPTRGYEGYGEEFSFGQTFSLGSFSYLSLMLKHRLYYIEDFPNNHHLDIGPEVFFRSYFTKWPIQLSSSIAYLKDISRFINSSEKSFWWKMDNGISWTLSSEQSLRLIHRNDRNQSYVGFIMNQYF